MDRQRIKRVAELLGYDIPLDPRYFIGGGSGLFGGGGGGGGGGNTVTRVEPPSFVEPFMRDIVMQGQHLFQNNFPQFFPGDITAPMNPLQLMAQQGAVGFLGGPQQSLLNQLGFQGVGSLLSPSQASQSLQGLTGAGVDLLGGAAGLAQQGLPGVPQQAAAQNIAPALQGMLSGQASQNPFFQSSLDAFTGEATRQFGENVLPQLRSSILSAGGPSTRGDLVQGQALGQLGSTIANQAANLQQNAFNQAIGQQNLATQLVSGAQQNLFGQMEQGRAQRAAELGRLSDQAIRGGILGDQNALQRLSAGLPLSGQFTQGLLGQFGALGGVGDQQRGFEQQLINDAIQRFQFEQNAPADALRQFAGFTGSFPGQTTTQQAPQLSGLQQGLSGALGGGLLAGGLQSAFPALFQGAVGTLGPQIPGALGAFGGPVGIGAGALLGGLLGGKF